MSKGRLEAFSDGVIAILITIMVFDIKAPTGSDWASFESVVTLVLTYLMSFVCLGIYWNNHHHMLHITERISGGVLWANLHLLFWLSLLPFATNWLRVSEFASLPTSLYGIILFLSAIAYTILEIAIIRANGPDSKLRDAIGNDVKGKISLSLYALAIGAALIHSWIAISLYVLVSLIWLIPDRRIEAKLMPTITSFKTSVDN